MAAPARSPHACSLRALLSAPGSYPAIAAAVAAGSLPELPVTLFDHVGDVYGRVERAAGAGFPEIAALRLTALVHEEPPGSLPALLGAAGVDDLADTVVAVIAAFGRVWKLGSERGLRDYVAAHRRHLVPILLFEVAHEGGTIPVMAQAAALGGLEDDVARWLERLA